jgi:hypothetical protein
MRLRLAAAIALAGWCVMIMPVPVSGFSARSAGGATREPSTVGHSPVAGVMKPLINPNVAHPPKTWDLMMPPLAPPTSSSIMDIDAPLRSWSIIASYSTRPACEAGKTITPSIPAKCIASDDARLKQH